MTIAIVSRHLVGPGVFGVVSALLLCLAGPGTCRAQDPVATQALTFTLWQLPSRTPSQHLSYVLRSAGGRLVVIDGGNAGDAEYLQGFLAGLGNRVDAWCLTHPHPDHVDALTAVLSKPSLLHIEGIYGSLPDEAWVAEHEPEPPTHLQSLQQFKAALSASGRQLEELALGQTVQLDSLRLEVLGVKNPEITGNAINNSSVVLRFSDAGKSVLFTGDLGVEGGQKLLRSEYGRRLPSDYVQMAHHGQTGVDEAFYQAVQPRFCLWPTPLWLWENNSGGGFDTGPWRTLEVRQWMDRLNVKKHYIAGQGLVRID